MPTEILIFRKKPILKITDNIDNRVKIQFGLKKAKLLTEHIQEIAKFIEDNEKAANP